MIASFDRTEGLHPYTVKLTPDEAQVVIDALEHVWNVASGETSEEARRLCKTLYDTQQRSREV